MDIALGELPIGVEIEFPWKTKGTFLGINEDDDAEVVLESKKGPGRDAIFSRHRIVFCNGVMSPHFAAVA